MAKTKEPTTPTSPSVRFAFRHGGYRGVDPQRVGEELSAMEVKPGDYHRTSDVLDAARHPDSALHGCFTWDDSAAAEAHRLDEARRLLCSISYVIVKGERKEKRNMYYHLRDAEGPRYVNANTVATDAELRQSALSEALTLLQGIRRRYEFLTELKPLFAAIDEMAAARPKKKRKKTTK